MNLIPCDEAAERSLLGAMILWPDSTVHRVVDKLAADDFYLPKHQWIYSAIASLFTCGQPIDPVLLSRELESAGVLRKCGGAAYLVSLTEVAPTASGIDQYTAMVLDKARLRKLSEFGARLQSLAGVEGSSVSELTAEAARLFRDLDRPDSSASRFDELVALWQNWEHDESSVIPTPWPEVNGLLVGGLAKGRLVTVGGRPSVGKSLGGLNIAAHAAEFGHTAVFFSLEMAKPEVATRILACGGSADMAELIRRKMSKENSEKVNRYIEQHRDIPLWVDDRERVTVEQIAAKCRSIPGLEVAVVDYLQLVTASDTRVSREQQVAHISRSLKILAREQNIAVVVAAQLNRGPVKEGKPREPTIADLRESGAVEQDSDQVLLLHRDEADEGIVNMICGKNRIGKTGSVQLLFEGKYARLGPLTEEYECLKEINFI